MTNKFRDLVSSTLSPESQTRAAARTSALLQEMHLHEVRRARALSQEELADRLGTTQPEISKIERRADVYVSTLRKFIRAMGGELEIIARFPNGTVRINQFHELDTRGVPDDPAAASHVPGDHSRAGRGKSRNVVSEKSTARYRTARSQAVDKKQRPAGAAPRRKK
jgi:transcriptional regulator with XRE-family HTH domain